MWDAGWILRINCMGKWEEKALLGILDELGGEGRRNLGERTGNGFKVLQEPSLWA